MRMQMMGAALCVMMVAGTVVAQSSAEGAPVADETLPRVLFLTHSAGFVHGVVKRESPDEPSHAERALAAARS